jgi:hypothetical protein
MQSLHSHRKKKSMTSLTKCLTVKGMNILQVYILQLIKCAKKNSNMHKGGIIKYGCEVDIGDKHSKKFSWKSHL